MIIRKMTASFGRLENETLELREGLNVIELPNEGGKSTWCAFLKAMLYGIDSAQRERGGAKPDKVKFAPWNGGRMSGEMDVEYGGRQITLRRSSRTQNAPMKEFSAVYSGTAEPVDGLTGPDAGRMLTGMPKAVFESSVFVRQSGLGVEHSAELERRIASIVSTGEEGDSYTEADAALRAWLRKRKYNRSGALPALDGEIAEKEGAIAALAEASRARAALTEQLARAAAREQELRRAQAEEAERIRQSRIETLEISRSAAEEAERALTAAREQELVARTELEGGIFAGKSGEEAVKDTETDGALLKQLQAAVKRPMAAWILLLAGLCLLAAGLLLLRPLLAAAAVCIGAAVVVYCLYNGHRKEYENYAEAMRRRYGTAEPAEIRALGIAYTERLQALEQAQQRTETLRSRAEACTEARHRAENALLCRDNGENRYDMLLQKAEDETAELRERMAVLNGRFSALGDPLVMRTEQSAMAAKRQRLQEQYDALNLALSTLKEANDEMQQRFSPELGKKASEYMEVLTGGNYDRLVFDRELNARARRKGQAEDHELDYLSAGTADQLYLALRLAICTLALPGGENCPLILDDALVNFDAVRMGRALELLKKIAETRQVLLFTCHSREAEYLKNQS